MARQRKAASAASPKNKAIPLQQPNRGTPTEKTLLSIAQERQLFAQADARKRKIDAGEAAVSPGAERFLEALLWTSTLAMLHFTFDVLVQNQYGPDINWHAVWVRAGRAWLVFLFLFYPLHPHDSSPNLVPFVPTRYQRHVRQAVFFVMSAASGCSLIYVTNTSGYLATMKRAPPLGCLWLWAVIELDLAWGALSLLVAGGFLWYGGYEIK